jgi:predicted metal-binding protein
MGYNSPYALSDVECYVHAVPSTQEAFPVVSREGINLFVCRSCFYGVHPHGGNETSDCKVLLKNEAGEDLGQCCCTWRKEQEEEP